MRRRPTISKPAQNHQRHAYALVSSLMAVVLISAIVVAFISNSGLDRTSSNSYKTTFLAEQALQAGLESAINLIAKSTATDSYLILQSEDANAVIGDPTQLKPSYLYVTKWENNGFEMTPLFSGADPNSSTLKGPAGAKPPASPPFQATLEATGTGYPKLPSHIPHAGVRWLEVDTGASSDGARMRYCFWMRDIEGLLDLRSVGNIDGPAQEHVFPTSIVDSNPISPKSTPVFPLFNRNVHTELSNDVNAKWDNRMIALKDLLLSNQTAYQLAMRDSFPPAVTLPPNTPKLDASKLQVLDKFGFANTQRYKHSEQIPYGQGYSEQGSPRLSLNKQIELASIDESAADTAVNTIASHILQNLPNFDRRKGASNDFHGVAGGKLDETSADRVSHNYVKTLSASMIDYADQDSTPTTATDYRGIDSFPLVNEIAERYERLANGVWPVPIKVTYYYELWNMSNQRIEGNVRLIYHNKQGIEATTNKFFGDYRSEEVPITIDPNNYLVVAFEHTGADGNPLKLGPSNSPGVPPDNLEFYSPDTYNNNYELYFNNKLVDSICGSGTGSARTNMVKRYGGNYTYQYPLNKNKPPSWNHTGSAPPVDTSEGRFGDPRASFYMHTFTHSHWYEKRGSMWGRNKLYGLFDSDFNEVILDRWPDYFSTSSGSSSYVYNTPVGKSAEISSGISNSNNLPQWSNIAPTDGSYRRPDADSRQAEKSVQIISNTGRYQTLAELGNIFDPAQWKFIDGTRNKSPGQNPVSSNLSGGGITLAIGRPDYPPFNPLKAPNMISNFNLTDSSQAYHANLLLDLLTTDELVESSGKVNINTAPYEVLRCLATGLYERDTVRLPSTLTPMSKDLAADSFAKSVVAARPFYSPSQFADMPAYNVNPKTPYFGNVEVASNVDLNISTNRPTALHDRTLEELFRRVYAKTSLSSRNFQLFVSAQVYIPARGTRPAKVISTKSSEFQIFSKPVRAGDNTITSVNCKVVRRMNQ